MNPFQGTQVIILMSTLSIGLQSNMRLSYQGKYLFRCRAPVKRPVWKLPGQVDEQCSSALAEELRIKIIVSDDYQGINLTAATTAMSAVPSLFGSLPLSSPRPPGHDALLAPLFYITEILTCHAS